MADYYPTAESTMELLTEGQRLKEKLRLQYADQIEQALRKRTAPVDHYYSAKTPTLRKQSSTAAGSGDDSNNADQPHLTKRQENVALGYLPPTEDEDISAIRRSLTNGSQLPSPTSTLSSPAKRSLLIKSTTKAIEEADDRERRLKALIDAHNPIRQTLRSVQDHALQSLIQATETSLAWEMRLATEENDPNSPIHKSRNKSIVTDITATTTTTGGAVDPAKTPERSASPPQDTATPTAAAASSSPHLYTTPFRDGGYAKQREQLEKRLGLLLKLQTEHKDLVRCEKAVDKDGLIYDERRRFIEEAVDVVKMREMVKAQEEARGEDVAGGSEL